MALKRVSSKGWGGSQGQNCPSPPTPGHNGKLSQAEMTQ